MLAFLIVSKYDNQKNDGKEFATQDYVRSALKYIAPGIIPIIINQTLE